MEKGMYYLKISQGNQILQASLASSSLNQPPPRKEPSASCELHPKVQVGSVTAGCQDEPWWLGSPHYETIYRSSQRQHPSSNITVVHVFSCYFHKFI